MLENIKTVIFDLDGTLIDSAPPILSSFQRTLEKNNLTAEVPLSESLIGPPLLETLKLISGIEDDVLLKKMSEDFKSIYDTVGYKETQGFEGITEMLNALLSCNINLYIATNKRLKPTLLIIDYLNWNSIFSAIVASDSVSPPYKNKGEMLSALMLKKGLKSDRTVYVGDRLDDYTSAVFNKLGFIAALWGYQDIKLNSVDAEFVRVEEPHQINELICN